MRIALLSWESKYSIAVGGLAEHVTELGAALVARGHEVHVFTRIGENQTGYDCIGGVHYHRCPYETDADFMVDNQRMCNSLAWHLVETEGFLGAPFDVVHAHDWLAVRALHHLKDRHQRPVVMTFHSTEFGRCGNQLFEGQSRRVREVEWQGGYVAQQVICVSGALQREVQGLYGVPGDKMHVVYNGVDVRRFDAEVDTSAARHDHAIGADDPMVLFAGRMTWQKGPDLLIEAIPGVLQDHPRTKFVFAGDGDMRAGLEHRAAALGIASAMRFLGHRNGHELVSLFKSADLVCVPSRNEPFGIVILEAWSAHKPVVTTRNGGPGEFVAHDDTGFTVSDDHSSIGWGVGAVLADETMRQRMGRNGRRQAESRFSWNTVAAETEHVYESVVNGRILAHASARKEEVFGMARRQSDKTTGQTTKTAGSTKTTKPAATTTKAKSGNGTTTATATAKTSAKKTTAPPKSTRTAASRSNTTAAATKECESAGGVACMCEPTHAEINQRAYEIFVARGDKPGSPEEDWHQAVQELRGA